MTSTFLEILNNATGQLASGITDSATSLVLGSGEGASFPSTFPFHISINNEIIEVGARSTDTLSSLVRAREGTTAASHSTDDAVELRLTAKIIDDITAAVNVLEDAPDHTSIADDAGTTKIQTEESPGEGKIRFDIAAVEKMLLDTLGLRLALIAGGDDADSVLTLQSTVGTIDRHWIKLYKDHADYGRDIDVGGNPIQALTMILDADGIHTVGWLPRADNSHDMGTAAKRWRDLYLAGTIKSAAAVPTSIQVGGSINIGADAAADDAASLDLTHTDKALLMNRLTTTQRDALTALNGLALYNTTLGKFQFYEDGAWVNAIHTESHDLASHSDAVPRIITFAFPEEDLSAAVFLPRPSFRLLDKLPTPTAEANQRFTVIAGTAGSGANSDVVLESAVSPFSSWTVQATIALDASQEVEIDGVFTGDWVWDPSTEKLRVRCSLMDAGTAPKYVIALFEYD